MKRYNYIVLTIFIILITSSYSFGNWSIMRQADWATNFRDITYTDEQNAWAVGDSGFIAVTMDGGKTWNRQNSSVNNNLSRVMFIDQKIGWTVGSTGTVLST
ncbi:hypothetical protein FJZ33_06515, partial [Candidatus Poribacteria bacterium]|nr:hypothetical protein [Candidatus Poribacteria bacterium]